MKLLFHRSQKMAVKIQKPGDNRAFVFDVQIGISKNEPGVDPLSGMLLNLVKVDEALQSLKSVWEQQAWSSVTELLSQSQVFLKGHFLKEGVSLHEVIFSESRRSWVGWRAGQNLMGQEEIREVEGEVYRLRWTSFLNESEWQQQKLSLTSLPPAKEQNLFADHPQLLDLEFEQLSSGEKWSFRKV